METMAFHACSLDPRHRDANVWDTRAPLAYIIAQKYSNTPEM